MPYLRCEPEHADLAVGAALVGRVDVHDRDHQPVRRVSLGACEQLGGHRDPQATADSIKAALIKYLDELEKLPPDKLRSQRNTRIDGFGVYSEVAN